jgi:hypothetical protein
MLTSSMIHRAPLARLRRPATVGLVVLVLAVVVSLAFVGPAAATAGASTPIALNSQWWSGNAGFGTMAPTAYLDDYGLVHLQGAAKQINPPCPPFPRTCVVHPSDPDLLGTLPGGSFATLSGVPIAPQHPVFTIAHTNFGTYADIVIEPNGQIWLIDPRPPAVKDYSFVSLEGISYDPGNNPIPPSTCTQIQINGNNWSPDFKYDTKSPAACLYSLPGEIPGSGGVHLEGAVTQISTQSSPSGPNVIGTIPDTGSDLPRYNIFTIAHTNFGTYADVEIVGFTSANAGEIILISPAFPAVTDYSFVSLEGISYDDNSGGLVGVSPENNWSYCAPSTNPCTNPFGAGSFFGRSVGGVEDSAGIVHLGGGIVQTSCCTSPGDAIAQLDPSLAPSWNVFEIVHTLGGTYADVEIQTDGSIRVIPPRSPAITNFGFLSLEGLTYAAASPKFFELGVRDTEHQGGTVTVMLRKPRLLALRVSTTRHHRLITIGVVHLGHHHAGCSKIHWNLRVNGRPLPPGRYQITLSAMNGNILSIPAPPGPRTLVVLRNGQVRVAS